MHLIKRTILSILLSVTLMMITPNKLSPVFNEIIIGAIYEPGEENTESTNTPTADKDDKDSTIHKFVTLSNFFL